MSVANKHVILGVTGGIAAYKSADLARRLVESGASVRVVMTAGAGNFITPLTMQAVSGQPVRQTLLDPAAEAGMGHIELARWADAVLVAPATANFMARLAHGVADDLLTTLCLATEARIAVAPAMNHQMWRSAATQHNAEILKQHKVLLFGPGVGDQACGETGPGRMLEPMELVTALSELFPTGRLDGLRVVVTAGPTWEAIDPVRGITNHSSGKMGYAVAGAAAEAGAHVILVSGPTALDVPSNTTRVDVRSAQDMHDAVMAEATRADIFIAVAAVADYRPLTIADRKIKKNDQTLTIELVRNPDILSSVAGDGRVFTVGFAAETHDVERNARDKLMRKGADLIAANAVGPGQAFGTDDNTLLLVDRAGTRRLPNMRKSSLARQLVNEIADRFHAKKNTNKDSRRTHRQ